MRNRRSETLIPVYHRDGGGLSKLPNKLFNFLRLPPFFPLQIVWHSNDNEANSLILNNLTNLRDGLRLIRERPEWLRDDLQRITQRESNTRRPEVNPHNSFCFSFIHVAGRSAKEPFHFYDPVNSLDLLNDPRQVLGVFDVKNNLPLKHRRSRIDIHASNISILV